MSLIGALNIGQSALAVQQAAIQVTGNNISNAGNADYTRQVAHTSPSADQALRPGVFVGTGVNIDSIKRQIDQALQSRIDGATSDAEGANTTQEWLGRVESLFNELSDQDISTKLSTFFNSWSDLANKPQDIGLRQVVLQNGQSLADGLKSMRLGLGSLSSDVDDRSTALAADADALAQKVADLNGQIVTAEGGTGGQANGLRDQRDAVLKQLSQLVNFKTVEQPNGVVDVYVSSDPLVTGTTNRGIIVKNSTDAAGNVAKSFAFRADNGTLKATSGQLGALQEVQDSIKGVSDKVDSIASNLIFELNKVHASGQGLAGASTASSTNIVADPTLALNDPKAGLDFKPANGSLVVHLKSSGTGISSSTLVKVDLDGIGGNDTTLNGLAAQLSGIAGVTATVNAGRLTIKTDSPDEQLSFSQDSSGVLAALGINSFYTGKNATNIGVNQALLDDPSLLAAAKNGEPGDNQTALDISKLESAAVAGLKGASIKDTYQATVNAVATGAQNAKNNADATQTVQQTLEAQRESLSGVSLDEEAINLVKQQRAFQGAARLISVIDDMLKTVLQLV